MAVYSCNSGEVRIQKRFLREEISQQMKRDRTAGDSIKSRVFVLIFSSDCTGPSR
jgi:hypothetical protein